MLNSKLSKQCTLINNNSKSLSECLRKSNEYLSFIMFEINDIEKSHLAPSKSHGHIMLSIRML